MEDDLHLYEIVANQHYSAGSATHNKSCEYQQHPSHSDKTIVSALNQDDTREPKDKTSNTKAWFVAIGVLITVLVILTALALALAALGYQKVEGSQTSPQQAASGNNTEIRREINELHTQLQQLRSQISNATLISDELLLLQGNFASVNDSLNAVNSDISSLDSQLQSDSTVNSIVSSRVNHLSLSISSVSATQSSQLQTVSSSLYRSISSVSSSFSSSLSRSISLVSRYSSSLSGSISSVSSSLSRSISSVSRFSSSLSGSISSVSSRFSSVSRTQSSEIRVLQTSNPYQNCIQETRNCIVNVLINSNKRIHCSTGYLSVNRTGYYTLDARCEFIGGGDVEVPSLQKSSPTSNLIFCQCSMITPASNGFGDLTSNFHMYCYLTITRCPQ